MRQILTTLATCLFLCAPALAAAAQNPTILVILADDLGYGDVQCYNLQRDKIPTPNIYRLTDVHGRVIRELLA